MNTRVLTEKFSEPLDGATTARIDIHAGDGNLTIDRLAVGEQVLANGTLQYFENQDPPTRDLVSMDGQAALTLMGSNSKRPRFRLPWAACNGATEWHIYLNPTVPADIIAHSDGGNVRLNLAGMTITRLSAETGGGNVEVVLPGNADNLNVTAKTGAGNVSIGIGSGITGSNTVNASSGAGDVVVRLPSGIAARIHATTGLGKTIISPQFSKIDKSIYQSSNYDSATHKVEFTVSSGAGNVMVDIRTDNP